MDGNKPDFDPASAFTGRLAAHSRVAYYPYPGDLCEVLVTMMLDELLVGEDAASNDAVISELERVGASDTGLTVFDPDAAPDQNVQVWHLQSTPGVGTNPDVAEAVWALRAVLAQHQLPAGQVAPNHVLIPADYHTCPFGPPDHVENPPAQLPDGGAGTVSVTVIDSGYVEAGLIVPARFAAAYGKWLVRDPLTKTWTWIAEDAVAIPGRDPRDQNADDMLDALAGHANFVAGVIAQNCPDAKIAIVSHNGAFVDADRGPTPVPTEAAVARSVWENRDAAVVDIGFAFPTLPDKALTAIDTGAAGPPSWAFQVVLDGIDQEMHMLVAPAGNQGCTTPQYPAAFGSTHENVVGVGSLSATGQRSDFSNHGAWVTCCTVGEDVVSTLFPWVGTTEERNPDGSMPAKDFSSGWASWSGTSFAAPQVAAAIAARVSDAVPPRMAWNALRDLYPAPAPALDMGIAMPRFPAP
jgi:subtilisin family serine protease